MTEAELERELAALADMDGKALHALGEAHPARVVPRVSPKLLRLALAWELQVAVHGGLSRRASQQLDQIAAGKTKTQPAKPGMRLVREWNGTVHVVTVGEDGAIRWNDREWRSLSEVARARCCQSNANRSPLSRATA